MRHVPAYTPPQTLDAYSGVQTSDAHTERDLLILVDLDEQKLSYRAIAAKHDVTLGVVGHVAAKWKPIRNIARKVMAAKALDVVDMWETAAAEAAKRGDHRPAKDWLLHAHEIEPIADAPTLGIQINVGNGSQPMQDVTAIPTITPQPKPAQPLTDDGSG